MGKMKEHYFEEISSMFIETVDHDALDAFAYSIGLLHSTGNRNKIGRPILHIGNMDENSTKK